MHVKWLIISFCCSICRGNMPLYESTGSTLPNYNPLCYAWYCGCRTLYVVWTSTATCAPAAYCLVNCAGRAQCAAGAWCTTCVNSVYASWCTRWANSLFPSPMHQCNTWFVVRLMHYVCYRCINAHSWPLAPLIFVCVVRHVATGLGMLSWNTSMKHIRSLTDQQMQWVRWLWNKNILHDAMRESISAFLKLCY